MVKSPNNLTEFWLYSDLVSKWTFYINVTTNVTYGEDYEFYWALLPINPTNIPFNNELPDDLAIYFDIYVNNTLAVEGTNITVYYVEADLVGINENDLVLYTFNPNTNRWEALPNEWFEVDGDNNIFEIYIPPPSEIQIQMSNIFAIGLKAKPTVPSDGDDDDDDKEKEAAIPGFEIYILIAAISLVSIAIIINHYRKFKI